MSHMATDIQQVHHERIKALVVPREHGAWGILLVPLVIGACLGLRSGTGLLEIILFLAASISLFWLRTPVESLLGTGLMRAQTARERRVALEVALGVGSLAAFACYGLFRGGHNYGLLIIACVAATAFSLQAAIKLFGRRMRMAAQMIGAIGLTCTAAGAYYVATGKFDAKAVAIWFACWLFAGDQIHYVQLRLHTTRLNTRREKLSRGRNFLIGQVLFAVAAFVACHYGLLPPLALLAFTPVVIRGAAWFVRTKEKLDIPWLGITELLHSITFGVLLITSFYLIR